MSEPIYNPDDPLAIISGEPETAHLALHDYAAMDGERSLMQLIQRYRVATDLRPPTKRPATIKEWSKRWQWQERLAAVQDIRLAAERARRDAVWASRREQIRDESWELAQRLRERALELLAHPTVEEVTTEITKEVDGKPVALTQTIIKPSRWAQRDIAGIAETFDKLARLSAGMDTAQIRIEGLSPADLSNMTDEELAKLESQLQRKQRSK